MGCFESLYRVAYGLICLASSTIESIRIQAREDVNCALVNDSKEWKQIEHFLGRAAQLHAERRYHQGAVDEDRVRDHRIQKPLVGR